MKKTHLILLSTIFLTACLNRTDVDLIVHNAKIFTVDERFSIQEAMAIRGDSIVEIGPEHQIMNKYSAPEILDVAQQFIYPGFIDAHSHFMGYAKFLNQLNLSGCKSKNEMFNRLDSFNKTVLGDWIVGRGWDQNDWEEKEFPDNSWLNEHFPDKYIVLKRVDGHAALVNQKVLDYIQVDENTQITGGKIGLINGKCSGILIDNAVDLISDLIPVPNDAEYTTLVQKAQENCFSKGLTSVTDAGLDYDDVQRIEQWQEDGILTLKLNIMLNPSQKNMAYYLNKGPVRKRDISIGSFKFYADGALGSRGANLLKPYKDDSTNFGLVLTNPDTLRLKANQIYDKGFQLNTHAIGDAANRMMLDIYGEILKGTNDRRWRIEHAQIVDPEDLSKFREFNILPSVQPTHATSDMDWAESRIGSERINNAYAYKSLKEQNGLIVLGTDFPVEDINPLFTILSAVRRTDKKGNPIGGFLVNEALSFEDCLKGMTIWAALANFDESSKGSLEVGKKADFVIINKDLRILDAENFDIFKIMSTYVNGKKVY